MTGHPRWRSYCALVLALLVQSAPASGAKAVTPKCTVLDLSPAFARDGTAFCATRIPHADEKFSSVLVFRTRDFGRSWHSVAAAGLDELPSPIAEVAQIVVSPMFATDRRVLVQLTGGTFESTDSGASFRQLSPTAEGISSSLLHTPSLTAYVDTLELPVAPPDGVLPTERRAVVAFAGDTPHRMRDSKVIPAVGATATGSRAVQFLASAGPTVRRLLVGVEVSAQTRRPFTTIHKCDSDLTCSTTRYRFGTSALPSGFWLHPSRGGGTIYGAIEPWFVVPTGTPAGNVDVWLPRGTTEVLHSRDGGFTFQPMLSVKRILDKIRGSSCLATAARIGFAFDRGRVYLRVSGWFDSSTTPASACRAAPPSPPGMPGDAIYESVDNAASWRRVAQGLGAGQWASAKFGKHVPWHYPVGPRALVGALYAGGGRLFVVAARGSYTGPFCSVDRGRTWAPTCR